MDRIKWWDNWSVTVKIPLMMVLVVAIAVAIISFITARREQQAFQNELQLQAVTLLDVITNAVADPLYFTNADPIQEAVSGLADDELVVFSQVYDRNGRVMADPFDPEADMLLGANPLGEQLLATEGIYFDWQEDRLLAGQAVLLGNQPVGAVSIALPTEPLNVKLVTARNQGIISVLVAVAAAGLLALTFSRAMTGRLLVLVDATERLKAGDFSHIAVIPGRDELATLANSFNDMSATLQVTLSELEDRNRELELVTALGRNLSQERDLETLLQEVVEEIQATFDLYYVQIYLVDSALRYLELRAGTGVVGQELRQRGHSLLVNAGSLNSLAVLNRQPIIVDDTERSANFQRNLMLPETRSEMVLPLIVGDNVVGTLDLQSKQAKALSSGNLAIFEALAGQVAVAIDNARLISELSETLTILEERQKYSIREDWNQYLDAIHRGERLGYVYEKGKMLPVTKAGKNPLENGSKLRKSIAITGEEIGAIVLNAEADHTWSDEELEMIEAISSQVSQKLENFRILEESERYRQEAEDSANRLILEGWRKMQESHGNIGFYYEDAEVQPMPAATPFDADDKVVDVPLAVRGAEIGHMEIVGSELEDDQITHMLTSVAARLSAHIENIRLNEQSQQSLALSEARSNELSILNEMSQTLAAQVNVDSVVETIYEYTSKLMDASNFYVALYDAKLDEIEFVFDITKGTRRWHTGKRRAGNGPTEYLLRTKEPLLMASQVGNHLSRLGIEQTGDESESWLGTPMVIGNQAIGVIGLRSYTTPNTYTEQHLRLLSAVASQAAIAIESARLFEQIQGQARQEQILREVTARVHAAVDAESVLRTAAQEINRSLGLEAFVYLENDQETNGEAEEVAATNGSNGRDATI